KGNMGEMPKLLGYPSEAVVKLERLPRGARFHITIAGRTPLITRARRVVTWPFTVRAAGRELQDAHETLQERYAEIDAATTALDSQRALLDAAYRLGQRIWSERDPTTMASEIAEALVDTARFAGASLEAAPSETPNRVERAHAGVPIAGERVLSID